MGLFCGISSARNWPRPNTRTLRSPGRSGPRDIHLPPVHQPRGNPSAPSPSPQGSLAEVTVTATRCTPPPLNTDSDTFYDPSDPGARSYFVTTYAGSGLSSSQQQALFNAWRNGPNAAPGIAPNTPDFTPVLLANVPGTPDVNWIYLTTNVANLSWTNVTLPGHYFYPGTVTNAVVTPGNETYLVTVGTGATPRWLQNDVLGSLFCKPSQLETLARFNGSSAVRIGSAGSCN